MHMSRTIGFLLRLVLALIVIGVVCRFLGITWSDVDNFVDNGLIRALRFLQYFRGAAHTPLS